MPKDKNKYWAKLRLSPSTGKVFSEYAEGGVQIVFEGKSYTALLCIIAATICELENLEQNLIAARMMEETTPPDELKEGFEDAPRED